MNAAETVWVIIGFLGQGLFFTRWVVQWLKSEREGVSTIPLGFWYLSLIGGLITLAYRSQDANAAAFVCSLGPLTFGIRAATGPGRDQPFSSG